MLQDQSVNTLLDDLKTRIEEGEIAIRKESAIVRDVTNNRLAEISDKLSITDSRITANEVLKSQYEVFLDRHSKSEKQWVTYMEEVRHEFVQMKT